MAIRYKVKVINNPSGLAVRQNPVLTDPPISSISNGTDVVINDTKTGQDGTVWFHLESNGLWLLYQYKGMANVKITQDLSNVPNDEAVTTEKETEINPTPGTVYRPPSLETGSRPSEQSTTTTSSYAPGTTEKPTQSESGVYLVTSEMVANSNTYKLDVGPRAHPNDIKQQNANNYPVFTTVSNTGEYEYDFYMNNDDLRRAIDKLKIDLNIPSAYTRDQINILMNQSFNRYGIIYPDNMLFGLKGVVFFTRPDIWVTDDNGNFLDQVENDPQLFYISRANEMILKQLTLSYTKKHQFIPLLCNQCRSLDIGDETVETVDVGETYVGHKVQYARHNIRSMVAGTFNCKFDETYDLAVTHMMQAWCSYESSVYIGTLLPKTEYIGDKILDYACDVYYFLVDRDNTIKFWSKYFGVFPTSVNKSAYSYDDASPIHMPDQNITFAYFDRKDLSPDSIVEFNKHSNLAFMYKKDHETSLGHGGATWVGPPFVEIIKVPNGTTSQSDVLKLRYRLL